MLVALGIQHAVLTRHIVVCGLSGCAMFLHIFPTNGTILEKGHMETKMCVLIFSTSCYEIFLILRRTEQDNVMDVRGSAVKYAMFLSDFNET